MITEEAIMAYGAGAFVSMFIFTRVFFETEKNCEDDQMCTRRPNYYGDGYTGYHSDTCRKRVLKPLQPWPAMWASLAWPVLFLYTILCWNFARAPIPISPKKRTRAMTQEELDRLDRILYNGS